MSDIIKTEVYSAYDRLCEEFVAVIKQEDSFWGGLAKRTITKKEYDLIGKTMGWK